MRLWVAIATTILVSGFFSLTRQSIWLALGGALTLGVLWLLRRKASAVAREPLPKLLVNNGNRASAPFVRAAGDLAQSEGALLVDARHVAAARSRAMTIEEQLESQKGMP